MILRTVIELVSQTEKQNRNIPLSDQSTEGTVKKNLIKKYNLRNSTKIFIDDDDDDYDDDDELFLWYGQ